jgi:hypothetical protein
MDSLVDLINAAQSLLDAGFDVQQFLAWKGIAFLFLLGLLGPLHYYTKTFCRVTEKPDHANLMAGEGVLMAIKEVLCPSDELPHAEGQDDKSTKLFLKRLVRKPCPLPLAQEAYRGNK